MVSTRHSAIAQHSRTRGIIALVLAVLGVLGTLVASPAHASTVTLAVSGWNVDESTGVVSYDLTVSDVCEQTSCGYRVDAYYVGGGVERFQGTVASGSVPGSSSTPVPFSKRIVGSASLPEITDLRATVMSRTGSYVTVSSGYAEGRLSISVNRWDLDPQTGKVTYEFDVSFVGAAQVGGPCDGSCYLWVDGFYRNGTTELSQRSFTGGGTSHGMAWTYTRRFSETGGQFPEITDIRARLTSGTAGNETYTTWVRVSDPYPTGAVSVAVNTWNANTANGTVTYDFDVSFSGAGQVGGPCDGGCYLWVEGLYGDGTSASQKYSFSGGGLSVGGR